MTLYEFNRLELNERMEAVNQLKELYKTTSPKEILMDMIEKSKN